MLSFIVIRIVGIVSRFDKKTIHIEFLDLNDVTKIDIVVPSGTPSMQLMILIELKNTRQHNF